MPCGNILYVVCLKQFKILIQRDYCVQLYKASCLGSPLSKSTARSSHGNILYVWPETWGTELAYLGKSCKSSNDQNAVTSPWTGSAGCAGLWSDAHSMLQNLGLPASGGYDYLYFSVWSQKTERNFPGDCRHCLKKKHFDSLLLRKTFSDKSSLV